MHLSATLLKPFLRHGYSRAVAKVVRLTTLKPIKEVHFQFDPFTMNTGSAREVSVCLQGEKILRTNPATEFTYKVVDDRSEPTIRARFVDGKQYLLKTANLSGLEIMEQLDRLVQIREPRTPEQLRPPRVRGK